MSDGESNGAGSQKPPAGPCPFSAEPMLLAVKKHFADLDEMRQMSLGSTGEMSKLVASQVQLNTTLSGISKNLENGFTLGTNVVVLFGRIVLVFLISLIILTLVVLYVCRTQIDYKDLHVHPPTQTNQPMNESYPGAQ